MGALRDGASLAYDPEFRRVCAAGAAYVASEVLNEPESTSDHAVRDFLARQVIRNPEGFERHFAWICAVSSAIYTLGPELTDQHETAIIQRITALWTFVAKFYYGGQVST